MKPWSIADRTPSKQLCRLKPVLPAQQENEGDATATFLTSHFRRKK